MSWTATQPDPNSARGAARATGRRVEVTDNRSETSTMFANPDGTFTLDQRLDSGRHTSATRRTDRWRLPQPRPVCPLTSAGGNAPAATLSDGGWAVSLAWRDPLPAPSLAGDTATYADVLPGVDLTMRASVEGFSEQLLVKSRAAAANPQLSEIRFGLAAKDLTFHQVAGGLVGMNSASAEVVTVPAPMMWDAGSGSARAQASIGLSLQNGELVLRPDLSLLTASSTRFPVTIDPSFNANRLAWIVLLSRFPNTSFFNGQGLQHDARGDAMVGDDFTFQTPARSVFRMNTSAINGKHILGATFQILEGWSASCSPRPVELWLTGPIDSSTTWNHQPNWTYRAATVNVARGNIHVQTTDSIDSSPLSANCEFSVDTTRPSSPPTVTSTDYPNDGNFHGGVGQTGSFTLGAAGVTDVAVK